MTVNFVHFSPEIVCLGDTGLISKGNTEYTKRDPIKPIEGFTTAYVTIDNRDTKKVTCAFMYDPSNTITAEEAIHTSSLPPDQSFMDVFQPTMIFKDDIERVTCQRSVEVQCKFIKNKKYKNN